MDTILSMKILVGVCGIVLGIGLLKEKAAFFLQFLLRAAIGTVLILGINSVLQQQGISIAVGLNPVSLLASASLGIPGVALLFAVMTLEFL